MRVHSCLYQGYDHSSNACFCCILDKSSTSLNNDNIDFNSSIIDTNYEKKQTIKIIIIVIN